MGNIYRNRSDLLVSGKVVRLAILCLVGALLLCHGLFGALHLCSTTEHAAPADSHLAHDHHASSEAGANTNEHPPVCHLLHAAAYYAVFLAAFLWLVFGLLLLKGARVWSTCTAPAASFRRFGPVVLHLPRGPTLPVLQVFQL
jgi:hypothetical protein